MNVSVNVSVNVRGSLRSQSSERPPAAEEQDGGGRGEGACWDFLGNGGGRGRRGRFHAPCLDGAGLFRFFKWGGLKAVNF